MLESARHRSYLAIALVATVAIGLLSRKCGWLFPPALGKYPGDALWAGMAYWAMAFVFPSASVFRIGSYALAISYADELSQLYHAPWIDQVRATFAGHLVLGSAFSWADIVAYTIGVGICAVIEVLWVRNPPGNR